MRRPFPGLVPCFAAACLSLPAGAATRPPPGGGEGMVRLCASNLVNFDDTPGLAVPSGLVFVAWGRMPDADLRGLRLDPNYPPARGNGQTALVLDAPAVLTAASPCAAVPAHAVVSPSHAWRPGPLLPGDGMVYQALDTLEGPVLRPLSAETHDLYDLLTMNVLAAQVAGPVVAAATIR